MQTVKITNIAELRTRKGSSNASVDLLGYYTEGDGGGGNFYWDNTSTATDNEGTIIQVTGLATGRWVRRYKDTIKAIEFGIVPDGNDMFLKIEQMIINTPTYHNVVFQKGQYTLNNQITVSRSNINIEGNNTEFIANQSLSHLLSMFLFENLSNVKIKNIKFNGNKSLVGGIGFGVFFKNCDKIKITTNELYEFCQSPIRLEDTTNVIVSENIVRDSGIVGYSDNHGIIIYSLDNVRNVNDNVIVSNNVISNIYRKGIASFTTGSYLNNIIIENNHVSTCGLGGIYMDYINRLNISNNICKNNYSNIVILNSTVGSIVGNICTTSNSAGISVYRSSMLEFTSNVIFGAGTYGIDLAFDIIENSFISVNNNSITNCNINATGYAPCISLDRTNNSMFHGNKLIDNRVVPLNTFGIYEQTGSTKNYFIANVTNNTSTGLGTVITAVNSISTNNYYYV